MPITLAIDTAAPRLQLGLLLADGKVDVSVDEIATGHAELMTALQTELSPAQLEAVLDNYTIGKVAFTLKGYKAIVPDLTADEEAKILGYLKQAREQAIDYKSMKEISAIFEIYKTKCEQFLNSNGRNWRTLFRAYVDKVKKEKAQKQQNN